jgi:hypothetical protein
MTPDGPAVPGFRNRPAWLVVTAALAVAQAGLAAHLFGPERPWDALRDARPVLDGRHPLHLYHASLGAGTFRDATAVTCYDPNFQAGYPKTPVFDQAARPMEPVLVALGAREFDPAAYKLGLFALCLLVPLVFVAAARGFGVPAGGTAWAGVGGCVVWWSPPVRGLLDAGHLDLLCVGLAVVLFLGGMARYASSPGVSGWAVMAAASVVGWYAHPVAWAGLLPAVAVFYLVNAPRHGLAWHLGSLAVLGVGVAANLWWLADWPEFWWVRRESEDPTPPNWAAFVDPAVAHENGVGAGPGGWALVAAAAVGLGLMVRRERCGAAGVLVASAAAALAAARLGVVWPLARAEGADHAAALVPALAVVPAAFAVSEVLKRMRIGPPLTIAAVGVVGLAGWDDRAAEALAGVVPPVRPLTLGFDADRQHLIAALRDRTTRDARILLEEPDTATPGWNWTALAPYLTDRLFLGGLDPDARLEHSFCGLRDGRLAGRPFADWTPAERAEFCRRYNVGWVLCRTPAAAKWWAADPTASEVGRFADGGAGVVLFELRRPRSFALSGRATVERMDRHRIVLTDVAPDADGRVRLSLHHQRQLRAAPLVWAEPEKDLHDPIPFLTLIAPGPVSRVTITWDHP